MIRIKNIITLTLFSKIAGSASRQDELVMCAWELPLCFPKGISFGLFLWWLWNSTVKLCNRLKSFAPLSRSIRTKLKPIGTCSALALFSRAWSDLLTLASSSDWSISISVHLSTNHRLHQNQSPLAWALSSRSWRDLQKMPTSSDCLMKIGRILIGFYRITVQSKKVPYLSDFRTRC